MQQELEHYNQSSFNILPSIESANADMRARGQLARAFSLLGPVFAEHNMCETWGIGLLHKHWHLEVGELPIQDVEFHEDRRQFITLPRAGAFSKPFSPSVFAVKTTLNPFLQALEFSSDLQVRGANILLTRNPQFVRDFCESILANGLEQTFGLVALRTASRPHLQLIEFNYEGRISIVRETIPSEIENKELIETSWRLSVDEVSGNCVGSCFSQCIVPASGGGHQHAHPHAHKP